MKGEKYVYMSEEQVTTIDNLIKDGHWDTLCAFGLECVDTCERAYKEGLRKSVGKGVAIGAVIALGCAIVNIAVVKHKKRKKLKEPDVINECESKERVP